MKQVYCALKRDPALPTSNFSSASVTSSLMFGHRIKAEILKEDTCSEYTAVSTHTVKTQKLTFAKLILEKLLWALEIITLIIWAMNAGPNTFLLHQWICRKETSKKEEGGHVPELTFIMMISYRLHLHHISEEPLLVVVIYRYGTTLTFRKTNVVELVFNVMFFCVVNFLLLSHHLRTVWGVYD